MYICSELDFQQKMRAFDGVFNFAPLGFGERKPPNGFTEIYVS